LNWYRGQDIFWQETPFLIGRKLLQPTLYVGGTYDPVVEFGRPYVDSLENSVPNLWNKVLLPGVGHWTEQEAPTEARMGVVEAKIQTVDVFFAGVFRAFRGPFGALLVLKKG
jgi:pimeloyl-ACP methyl ester carboxylesterase